MFDNSLKLVEDCGLTFLHVFPFSPRKGTPAARMPQVSGPVVKERAARLRQRGEAALSAHLDQQVGSRVELLIERERLGRTPGFAELELDAPAQPGTLTEARVIGSTGRRLRGELVATMCAA
jgi:threonylcarbamoyladenosine tRNA methylthiotransferase MtaB